MADTPSLDAPELSLADFRALRENRPIPEIQPTPEPEKKPSEVGGDEAPADKAKPPAGSEPSTETAPESETAETTESQETQEKPKPESKAIRDLAKLRRDNRELRERLERLAQTEQPPAQPPPEAKKKTPLAEPDASKYDTYPALIKDQVNYSVRTALEELEAQRKQEAAEAARLAALQEKAQSWQERTAEAQKKYSDYDTVARGDYPVTNEMAAAITDSDVGTEILYWLGSHRDESTRISRLAPLSQIREIGKLEALLSKTEGEETPQPQLAVSKAPAPIPKPASGAPRSSLINNPDKIGSQAEWRALRESGKLR